MIQIKKNRWWMIEIIPILGILTFVGLYFFSTTLYPGGSQENINSEGFDWINNYWCNLLNETAINGQPNIARPYAILGMVILCMSLMAFFILFANICVKSLIWKRSILINGVLSMTFAALIFTKYHDLMTILSSVFGLVVVIGIIKEIFKSELRIYKITGALCIILLALNNYIYYSDHFIEALPLLQKISFALVLTWIIGLNLQLIQHKKMQQQSN